MLNLENIDFGFGSKAVLQNINISFSKGGVYGILGNNGAGKTTLFRTLFGMYKPDSGKISYRGQAIKRSDISFLESNNYYYPYITGNEHLQLVNGQIDTSKYADLFNLPLDEYVENYSTGMKKKLSFASVLIQNRDILLLDEPFSGVDLMSNELMMSIIHSLKENKLIILSSHILGTLTSICDEICLLESGEISQIFKRDDFQILHQRIKSDVDEKINQIS